MKMKCMICGRCLEYVRDLSNARTGLRVYTCWTCDLSYKLELKEHIAVGILCKAR